MRGSSVTLVWRWAGWLLRALGCPGGRGRVPSGVEVSATGWAPGAVEARWAGFSSAEVLLIAAGLATGGKGWGFLMRGMTARLLAEIRDHLARKGEADLGEG